MSGPFARTLRAVGRRQDGGAALEFALVLPAFVMMLVGGFYASDLVFTVSAMHYAVEDGARCAAVQTTVCTGPSAIVTFTQNHYAGPAVSPTFTYSTAGCGHAVTGTVTYDFDIGTRHMSVPISTTSCYP
jgi:Flp pilus assembly protein TadG